MKLHEVMPDILKGRKLSRTTWCSDEYIQCVPNNGAIESVIGGEKRYWIITQDDLLSNDWYSI